MFSRRFFETSALAAVLLATAACENRSTPRRSDDAVAIRGSLVDLSLAFHEDDARAFEDLHDSYQAFVRYVDSTEIPPALARTPGKVKAGVPLGIGAVRRLPKVEIGLDLFRGDESTYKCKSGVVNLAKTLATKVEVPLRCSYVDADGQSHTIETKPVVVTIRRTVDLDIVVDGAKATEKAMALATNTGLILRQEGSYGGTPALFEFMASANPSRNDPSFTVNLVVSAKVGGETLVSLKNACVKMEELRLFLAGGKSDALLLDGTAQVLARENDATEARPLMLPAQLSFRAPRGTEWVLHGENRSIRMPFVAEFLAVDGMRPDGAEPFSGELLLRDEAPAPESITVATYNVEGMSDDVGAGFPWEWSAQSSNWIKDKMYDVKARHIAEALMLAGSPDVVAMQEFKYVKGNGRPLEVLANHLAPQGYKFKAFGPQRPLDDRGRFPSDTEVVLSKYPIVRIESLPFDTEDASGAARDPLVVTIDVNGNLMRLYVVHTRAKRSERTEQDAALGDSLRRAMLELVRADIDRVREKDLNADIVVMGDMNANYFEAPIREGLQSTGDESRMMATNNDESSLYNLWYDIKPEERCGTVLGGKRHCIDNMLVSSSLYDNHGFQYVDNSFRLVGASGLAREKLVGPGGNPIRWETRSEETVVDGQTRKYTVHLGKGYSDHLPLVATFRVMGDTGNASRMTLAGEPSAQLDHNPEKTYVRIRNCTDDSGEFLAGEKVVDLSATLDLSKDEFLNACFRLEGGAIPIRVVDTYDTRKDFGFDFASASPLFKSASIAIQFGDMNPGGRSIDRNGIMKRYVETIEGAQAAGKTVTLEKFKGRLGMSYGKITLYAEELPGLVVSGPAAPN